MDDRSNFDKYLEKTLQITRELTLNQMQKQWGRMMNYEYRIKKIRQFIDYGFIATFIIGAPLATYRELNSLINNFNEEIRKKVQSIERKIEE